MQEKKRKSAQTGAFSIFVIDDWTIDEVAHRYNHIQIVKINGSCNRSIALLTNYSNFLSSRRWLPNLFFFVFLLLFQSVFEYSALDDLFNLIGSYTQRTIETAARSSYQRNS